MTIYRIPVELVNSNIPSPAVNVWHARVETAGDIKGVMTDPSSGVMAALNEFYSSLAAYLAGGTTITFPASVVEVTSQEEAMVDTPPSIVSGSMSAAPGGLALCVSWGTASRTRRGRGRTFVGPLGSGVLGADGKPYPAYLNSLRTAAATLVGHSAGVNGWALGVWGQQTAGIPEPKVLRDITSAKVNAKFAHLRSRRD